MNPNNYVIDNFTFYNKYKNSVQIDHIVIDTGGIHVVETKNWMGTIVGSIQDAHWKAVDYHTHEEYERINAYKQNQYHIDSLSYYLRILPEFKGMVDSWLIFLNSDYVDINGLIFMQKEKIENAIIFKPKYEYKLSTSGVKEVYEKLLELDLHIPLDVHIQTIRRLHNE